MARSVAEHLVDIMVRAGIQNVYGMVGDSANPVVDAIRRADGKLTFIQVRNEEAGAFAAGAEAMITGRPTAVLGSSGPGSLHLLNGLYDCDRNGAPVFAIVTHIPSPEIGTEYFQETRPELIFADCTRYVGLHHVSGSDAAAGRARLGGGDPGARCRDGHPARRRRRHGGRPSDRRSTAGEESGRRSGRWMPTSTGWLSASRRPAAR